MNDERRSKILSELAKYTGKAVSWRFIKQTDSFIPAMYPFSWVKAGVQDKYQKAKQLTKTNSWQARVKAVN